MVISVPFGVAVGIMILGALIWIVELGIKARARMNRRETRQQLARDLTAPRPSTQLPYGLSEPEGPTGAQKRADTG